MKVVMLSTFGPEVRGISYYSDCLLQALNQRESIQAVAVDFASIYPEWLHPGSKGGLQHGSNRVVHYAKPRTWSLLAQRPDLIHLQSWSFATVLMHRRILKEARRHGIPAVVTVHNPAAHERSGLLSRLENSCLRLADRIILHDACGVDALPAAVRDKVRIIHHGTEGLAFSDAQLAEAAAGSPYLLYFGNIRPYKGVTLLLEAWRDLAPQFPAWKLVIAGQLWQGSSVLSALVARLLGTGQAAREIRRLAQDPGLRSVDFRLGFIPDAELDTLLLGARYAVFPYLRFSGHSGAVARAAARGVPVLVSEVGGLPSLAIDANHVFRPDSTDSLRKVLTRLMTDRSGSLEERRQQLVRAGELSWHNAAERHLALYRELLATPGRGGE